MQFVRFQLDGGATVYFKKDDISVIVEDNLSPAYTHIYVHGQDKYFKVLGHYRGVLSELGIKP